MQDLQKQIENLKDEVRSLKEILTNLSKVCYENRQDIRNKKF